MNRGKIVVLGASGFVGTALTERLSAQPGVEVVPVIHSAGSAWRLARDASRPLLQLDIADRNALAQALAGASGVVNCTRGSREVMVDGLRNILAACREAGVARFVHLSSVMVYGDPPHPASHREDAPTMDRGGEDSYGLIKLDQDDLVQRACKAGLPSVVLCPPNISGPFSLYLAGIVSGIRKGSFALMDDGAGPCNLVDVRNLCHAIELALAAPEAVANGQRLFVSDGHVPSWANVVDALRPLTDCRRLRVITRPDLERLVAQERIGPTPSMRSAVRHLVSSDVRAALRKDPLLAKIDKAARSAVAGLGKSVEGRLRRGIEGVVRVRQPEPHAGLTVGLCAQQLRGVAHQADRATEQLGYEPLRTFGESMEDFRRWFAIYYGQGAWDWALASSLI